MFDQLKNLASIMKNAGAIRQKVEQFKAEMEHIGDYKSASEVWTRD